MSKKNIQSSNQVDPSNINMQHRSNLLMPPLSAPDDVTILHQPNLQHHQIKPTQHVCQQCCWHIKLCHATLIKHQDMGEQSSGLSPHQTKVSKWSLELCSPCPYWQQRLLCQSCVHSIIRCHSKKDGHTFIENKHLRLSQHMVCQQLLTVKHQIALTFLSNALAKQSNCPCPANNVSPSCTSALRPLGRLSTYDFKWA